MSSFRDALTAYAIGLKGRRTVVQPDFEVTDQMHEEFWRTLVQRGFTLERRLYDGAKPVLTRLLAREIARYVIGPEGEIQRSIRDDSTIQRAAQILRGAARSADVFRVEPTRS